MVDVKQVEVEIASSSSPNILVIGIAGGSGSGKTTLAQAIYKAIGEDKISYITHDSYYKDISHLSLEERGMQNFDHPDSLDTGKSFKPQKMTIRCWSK